MSQIDLYKKDQGLIKDDLKKIMDIKVGDVMNTEPLVLVDGASIEEASRAFTEHHKVNPIPIVNHENKVIGVLSRYDMNKLFGASGSFLGGGNKERNVDKDIKTFIDRFDKDFVFVSKSRTHLWIITSILFAIFGYIMAWMWILKIF